MRYVPAKTQDEQAAGMVLKARDLLIRQRTQTINALRAHLAELGIVRATGLVGIISLAAIVGDDSDLRLPGEARMALEELVEQIETVTARIERLDRKILEAVRKDDSARRLTAIPGVGPIIAATIRAVVPDPAGFRTGRDFAAWIGLTPRAHSSGGKERIGSISKRGNQQLRTLLVAGATSILKLARRGLQASPWIAAMMLRRPFKVVAVALANKIARIIWALLVRGDTYRGAKMIVQA